MKRTLLVLCAMAAAAAPVLRLAAAEPRLDVKKIINESNSFLKEREPEMTEEEYALYQKMASMLSTNPEFALKLLEAMISEKEPPSPAFNFILGNAYYAAGQNEKSEASYLAAVKAYPTFLRAWVNLGILYYATERYNQAVPCFAKAVTLGDRDAATLGLLGYCLERDRNLVSAEVAYMQALSGDPTNPDWLEGMLRISIEGKQYARAESMVKSLIKDHPTETRFWLVYANILLSEGRKIEATVLLETACGMGVAGNEELALLGDLYADQDMVPEAAEIYRRLLAAAPEVGARKLLHYSQVLLSDGKLQEAAVVLDRVKPDGDRSQQVEIMQTRADLLFAQKKWSDARRQLDALLDLEPLNGKALLSLGRVYAAQDDVPRATFAFEAASRVASTTYVASLELANIELKNRHYAQCVEHLQKALSIEKTEAVLDFLARVKTLVPVEGTPQP